MNLLLWCALVVFLAWAYIFFGRPLLMNRFPTLWGYIDPVERLAGRPLAHAHHRAALLDRRHHHRHSRHAGVLRHGLDAAGQRGHQPDPRAISAAGAGRLPGVDRRRIRVAAARHPRKPGRQEGLTDV